MNITINEKTVKIFTGAKAVDAIRKYLVEMQKSPADLKSLTIYDKYGHEIDGEAPLKKAVMSITTDSQDINAPKNPEEILLFQIVRGFAKPEVVAEVEEGLKKGGMGYGTIKKMLLAEILAEITPLKEKYDDYQAHLDDVEDMLQMGAKRARAMAKPVLEKVRKTVLGK